MFHDCFIFDYKFRNMTNSGTMNFDAIDDDNLVWAVFEDIALAFSGNYHNRYEILSQMNIERQMLYAVWKLDMEVKNGGFNQYFYNTEGKLKYSSAGGLRKIGALKLAALVNEANEVYFRQHQKITEKQNGSLEGFSASYKNNPLNEFDSKYYRLAEEENLEELLVKFIRNNRAKFVG